VLAVDQFVTLDPTREGQQLTADAVQDASTE
jgi:hypothetical protein